MDPVVTYYGKGRIFGFLGDPNVVIDVVPVDMVVNATLAAIAKHGGSRKPEINVYHVASSVANPLVYKDLANMFYKHFSKLPMLDSEGKTVQVKPFKFYTSIEDYSSQVWREMMKKAGSSTPTMPKSVGGNENLSTKLEKICMKIVKQAMHVASLYEPYVFYGGRFDNTSTRSLIESMSDGERRAFHFDIGSIEWEDYITNVHIPALRKHVVKERRLS